jgi:hypothetical protein
MTESRLKVIEQESSKASAVDDLQCPDPDEKTAAAIIKKKTVPQKAQKGVANEDSAKHD